MKKVLIALILIVSSISLVSCRNKDLITNNTDSLTINVSQENIKIMQLTDLHLTYGFDHQDRKTYKLIDKLIITEKPDVIIVTGDLFMSIHGRRVFKQFIKFMDGYDIPWSLVFGNHEAEFMDMELVLDTLLSVKTKNLYFAINDKVKNNSKNGFSNFRLELKYNDNSILNLYLLDTKLNRTDGIVEKNNNYDYLSNDQVNWYKRLVKDDTVNSLAFMHIPLRQYLEYDKKEGMDEPVHAQAVDTGFYDAMTNPEEGNYKTLGVFSGHDHLNNFSFRLNNDSREPLLAYGLTSGYNAYGKGSKGARIINYNNTTELIDSYLVFDKELGL